VPLPATCVTRFVLRVLSNEVSRRLSYRYGDIVPGLMDGIRFRPSAAHHATRLRGARRRSILEGVRNTVCGVTGARVTRLKSLQARPIAVPRIRQ